MPGRGNLSTENKWERSKQKDTELIRVFLHTRYCEGRWLSSAVFLGRIETTVQSVAWRYNLQLF